MWLRDKSTSPIYQFSNFYNLNSLARMILFMHLIEEMDLLLHMFDKVMELILMHNNKLTRKDRDDHHWSYIYLHQYMMQSW